MHAPVGRLTGVRAHDGSFKHSDVVRLSCGGSPVFGGARPSPRLQPADHALKTQAHVARAPSGKAARLGTLWSTSTAAPACHANRVNDRDPVVELLTFTEAQLRAIAHSVTGCLSTRRATPPPLDTRAARQLHAARTRATQAGTGLRPGQLPGRTRPTILASPADLAPAGP